MAFDLTKNVVMVNIFSKFNKVKKQDKDEIQEETQAHDVDKKSKTKKEKKKSTKDLLAEKEIELAELKDKYLRIFAEFDNFKKRTIKEKMEFMRNASRDVMNDLLPVLDDFDRAKQSADDDSSEEVFTDGVNLVYNKFQSILKSKGLKEMETTGKVFDSELHEAITKIPSPTEDMKGKVIDTIQKGYYLNDTIIRHAKVVVGE